MRPLNPAHLERFRAAVTRCLGLSFDDSKLGLLADVFIRRIEMASDSADSYLIRLEAATDAGEVGALAAELTVAETYFFRNNEQYRACAEIVLPDRIALSCDRSLQLLSAGCASGEEAYSLAMVARAVVDPSWQLSILGVDVNPAMVSRATRATYSPWALRETPAEIQQRWFRPHGRDFLLDEDLRAAVRFEVGNLVTDDPRLWPAGTYDVVFFRNVLMYFTPEMAHAAVARLTRALKPGGYLFLGHAETLRGLSSDFHLQHTHGTFYYQRRDRLTPPVAVPSPDRSIRATAPAAMAAVESGGTWIGAIRGASQRIEALAGLAQPGAVTNGAVAMPAWDLGLARDLLREERFGEAVELMRRLPADSQRDPDALLLSAALQTHRGKLADAEDACRRLLDLDELNAGAHYLLALCREGAGDLARAVYHDRVAVHLDPSFAMPHLHLGLLARRAGDRAAAHQELAQALQLLQWEDGPRLLLFGGGFGREALMALCRTELTGSGGAR